MTMKKGELLNLLEETIMNTKHSRFIIEQVKDKMLEYGIMRGVVQKIFMGEVKLGDLDSRVLILFAHSLADVTEDKEISPELFFSRKTIKKAKESSVIDSPQPLFPIVLEHANKLDENTYSVSVDLKQLVELYNSNVLEYNYDIDKRYKLLMNKEGNTFSSIQINLRKAKETAKDILNGKYEFGKITLNVLKGSGIEDKDLEMINDTLVINESKIDIVSGLQDLTALSYAYETKPNLKLKVEIEIKHLDLTNIKKYFNTLNIKGLVN